MKLKKVFKYLTILGILMTLVVLSIDQYIQSYGNRYIKEIEEVTQADAILILGASVYSNGRPSPMLEDRLIVGLELYNKRLAPKIIVSGDHGTKEYNEVGAMREFLINHGVADQDIFMDHAGFSTYESMYRARDIFQAEQLIIVTQEYHLKRAIYLARKLGMESTGVASDLRNYGPVMTKYELREKMARNKDFFLTLINPKPTYLGDPIPVNGDGRGTHPRN